jgi:CheY-like chemotaxis protein
MHSILVVDYADVCRNMADLFGDLDYMVDTAVGGGMALVKAGQRPDDLGLLDLRMPGMDGLTLCRHLGRLCPRMVTMLITAYGASRLAAEARDAGARHILSRPIDSPSLMALVEQALPATN